jgi:Fur family ferric uptake transcriptional regulator
MHDERVESVIGEMQHEGHRITPLRREIIDIFLRYRIPQTVEALQTILKKRKTPFHKVSLYRELDFLVRWQFLRPLHFGDGVARYETSWHAHHHHLVCTKCTTVVDVEFPESPIERAAENAAKKHLFSIRSHALEFFGLCQKCQYSR